MFFVKKRIGSPDFFYTEEKVRSGSISMWFIRRKMDTIKKIWYLLQDHKQREYKEEGIDHDCPLIE